LISRKGVQRFPASPFRLRRAGRVQRSKVWGFAVGYDPTGRILGFFGTGKVKTNQKDPN